MRAQVAAIVCLLSVEAFATAMVRTDVSALSTSSDVVVRGTVKKLVSRWTDDRMKIITEVEVQVDEALKGAPAKTITILQPGGVVGDLAQRVMGLAHFEPQEEVVVFLEKRPGNRYRVRGMAQGKFKVERSSDGQRAFAVPESTDEALVLDPLTRKATAERHRVLELSELKAKIQAAVKKSKP